jgi:hypothetical protein
MTSGTRTHAANHVARPRGAICGTGYNPRSSDARDRDDSGERNRGSRGGTSDHDRCDDRGPRDGFTRDLNLPRGRERRPCGTATASIDQRVREPHACNGGCIPRLYPRATCTIPATSRERRVEGSAISKKKVCSAGLHSAQMTAPSYRRSAGDLLEASGTSARTARGTAPGVLRGPEKPSRADARQQGLSDVYAEDRLRDKGGRVNRVVLDYELTRDYQRCRSLTCDANQRDERRRSPPEPCPEREASRDFEKRCEDEHERVRHMDGHPPAMHQSLARRLCHTRGSQTRLTRPWRLGKNCTIDCIENAGNRVLRR